MGPSEKRTRRGIVDQPIDFAFMTPSAWIEFNCELYDAVTELDVGIERIESGVMVLHGGVALDLLPLAQHCQLRPTDEWGGLVVEHLHNLLARMAAVSEDADHPLSMIDLRVRLVPDSPLDARVFEHLGARPYAEGIVQVLSADTDTSIRPVAVREVEQLGWDAESAWAGAWAQTRMLEQPDEIVGVDVGGADILHICGERPFTASLAESIEDVLGPLEEHGALVSVPHGHSVLVHPIENLSVPIALNAMIPITRRLFSNGPSSVSPHIYWWRSDGGLQWIPTYFAPDGMEAYPSPELVEVLRSLR